MIFCQVPRRSKTLGITICNRALDHIVTYKITVGKVSQSAKNKTMEPPVVIDLVPDSPPVQPVSNSLNLILNQDNSGSNRISNATALPVNTAKGKPQVPSVAKTANTNKTLNTIPNTMKTTTKAGRTVKSSGAVKSGTGKDSPLKNSRSKSSQGATKSSKGSSNGSQGKEGSVSSQVNSYEEMEKKIISRFAASRQKLSYGRLIGHLHDKAKFDEGIKKLPLYLGRTSTSVPEQYAKATKLNIGDSKSASRYHAMIEWDSTVHQLRIHCLGRNGVLLDGKILLEGKSELLAQDKSTAICIGGAELYFCPAISMDFPTSNHCAFVQMVILYPLFDLKFTLCIGICR